jgi:hypothetical protein
MFSVLKYLHSLYYFGYIRLTKNASTLKKKKILTYKQIRVGSIAKLYMSFLIYEEMRKYFTIHI